MRTFIFILFSALIGYLTKDIWTELNPWYYKVLFLSTIIITPFFLYSIAAIIALETGWFFGVIVMIAITIIDHYTTNALAICIISKCNRDFFDFSGFRLTRSIFNLPWYSYLVSGVMGAITGAIGERQRKIERERSQKAAFLAIYLLAGQFLGMAVPELTPVISRITPVVSAVMTSEIVSKTGSLAIGESAKIGNKNIINKTEPTIGIIAEEVSTNLLKVKYFKYSYLKNGQKTMVEIPDFSTKSIFETKLPTNLHIANDEVQFAKSTNLLDQYIKANPKQIETLKNMNKEILKRDIAYFEKNKINILEAQEKMLESTKNGDLIEQGKWLKELRKRTQKITFIQTPKGKPFVILDEQQILAKQLEEISRPILNSKGRIFGYVWHHTEKPGIMQLVPKDVHEFNRHIGGNAIWGGNIR